MYYAQENVEQIFFIKRRTMDRIDVLKSKLCFFLIDGKCHHAFNEGGDCTLGNCPLDKNDEFKIVSSWYLDKMARMIVQRKISEKEDTDD